MQWLGLIASFVIGRMNNKKAGPSLMSPQAIFEDITFKSRKVVMLTLGAVIAVVLLCSGLMMSIIDATTQYDKNSIITFSATFNTGLVLALLAVISFTFIFTRAWPGVREHRNEFRAETKSSSLGFSRASSKPEPHHAGGLEQAISALIVDFVKEREVRRQSNARPTGETYGEQRARTKGFEQEPPPVYHS
jgi:hypothetical protein